MNKKDNFTAAFTERFDLPADVLPGTAVITLNGSRRLHIERHRGILEYGREFISVNCGSNILGVYGAALELASMNATELLIIGDIQRIEFE